MIEIKNGIYLKVDQSTFYDYGKIDSVKQIVESYNLEFLNDGELHITLCSNLEFKPFEKKLKAIDLSQFVVPELIYGKESLIVRETTNKMSLVVPILNQSALHKLMNDLFQSVGLVYPEKYRFFHITIANNEGGDKYKSISNVLLSDFLIGDGGSDIFFDMDGVLADFESYVDQDELVSKYRKELYDNYPETSLLGVDEMRMISKENEHIKKLYKPLKDRIFEIANKKGFFLNLPLKEGAKEMLVKAIELSGKLPHILTSPMMNSHCANEKEMWMAKHFDGLYDQVYITKNKNKLVRCKNDLLIDDRSKYCELFESSGGRTIKHISSVETINQLNEIYK
jgi:5'(3')-deoxyribonucleotidase